MYVHRNVQILEVLLGCDFCMGFTGCMCCIGAFDLFFREYALGKTGLCSVTKVWYQSFHRLLEYPGRDESGEEILILKSAFDLEAYASEMFSSTSR